LSGMSLSKEPVEGRSVTIRFEIENPSGLKIRDSHLLVEASDGFSYDKKLTLYPGKTKKTSVRWRPEKARKQTITATVECKTCKAQKGGKKTLSCNVEARP